jgi:putative redox protein
VTGITSQNEMQELNNSSLDRAEAPHSRSSFERTAIYSTAFRREVTTMGNNDYKATVRYAGDHLFVGIPPSGTSFLMDSNFERRSAPSPLEHLLVSVAGCTAFDVQPILQKKRQDVTDYWVEISGERREEHPRAFIKFNIKHVIHGRNISEKAVVDAIELSNEKYCSVAATVRPTAEIHSSYEIVEVGDAAASAAG